MSVESWIVEAIINNPDLVGWAGTLAYLMYEIRGPRGRVNQLMSVLKNTVTIVRGLARVHDDIDTEAVDDYLVENGLEPGDFIKKNEEEEIERLRDKKEDGD